jgi:DNA-binding NtrC family response regulator
LVLGETGTGKEIVTRFIHHHGLRPDRPFVQVNCTAIPETLFEAELFGYEKGSFTDAKSTKKGLIEMAQEGTLFLDEIGDMPLATQAKLLVAIESGRFRRIGATAERMADVRVVAATNSDLQRKVDQGTFRADLFYRLKVFTIDLPPLRERGDDLFLLTDYFLEQSCRKLHKVVPRIPPDTRELMRRYAWPGNVRELANVLQRAVLVNDGDALDPSVLGIGRGIVSTAEVASASSSGLSFDFRSDDCTLDAVERRLIQAALQHTGGNVSETARILGLTRGGLRHRMDKLGLVEARPPKDSES